MGQRNDRYHAEVNLRLRLVWDVEGKDRAKALTKKIVALLEEQIETYQAEGLLLCDCEHSGIDVVTERHAQKAGSRV
ncbi:MAG TPA: hypothetical protein VFB38_04370 [Chthonomonadaceae bacterium]|nr:hypothetical protein [Chthonomonadaceae bacterium]